MNHSNKKYRYTQQSKEKANGINYTPKELADFLAKELLAIKSEIVHKNNISIFDPAIGEGQLIDSLLSLFPPNPAQHITVSGCDTDDETLARTHNYLSRKYQNISLNIIHADFLAHINARNEATDQHALLNTPNNAAYDIIIANPPYVRTQSLGSNKTQRLAKEFNLSGRIDLYHAFIIGISCILDKNGIAGIITSNRFMTTKSGASTRRAMKERFSLSKIWDFGDTKIFNAAVLPAVVLLHGTNHKTNKNIPFSSIYSHTTGKPTAEVNNPTEAITHTGIIRTKDGRQFMVQHGLLDHGPSNESMWRITTSTSSSWLERVKKHTWKHFGDIGKIRVGVKTTADKVFISSDWETLSNREIPELLRPLTTHHIARCFKALPTKKQKFILYPHTTVAGSRCAADLAHYPNTEKYLLKHKAALEARKYVIEAGRKWYEIWVPQDPTAWDKEKLVFRDISEKPTFWIDRSGSIINGDCYWLICDDSNADILWLAAAVANSSFIEKFYDSSFCNKLFSGRRRFITQYVEKFPLPHPETAIAQEIILLAKTIYNNTDITDTTPMQQHLDGLIWRAFGVD